MADNLKRCYSCGADWEAGAHSAGCEECSGGALERPCMVCGGRCGATWTRAILDSHDSRVGHWAGKCNLPREQQMALMMAELDLARLARPKKNRLTPLGLLNRVAITWFSVGWFSYWVLWMLRDQHPDRARLLWAVVAGFFVALCTAPAYYWRLKNTRESPESQKLLT